MSEYMGSKMVARIEIACLQQNLLDLLWFWPIY
jgi:hypothetical protein